jgi:L-threonylcarbamoyladenylate synthase
MLNQLLSPEDASVAVELLLKGGIVAFPTDTVYGLAAHPSFPDAIDRLFTAKKRPIDKAIPVLLAEVADLEGLSAGLTTSARALAHEFWPGPLTIVVARRPTEGFPATVAVRIPDHELARAIIHAAGGALAVTSANISGGPNCTTAQQVLEQLAGSINAIVDGGDCPGGIESTVVDATQEQVRVLRSGAIPPHRLSACVPLEQ